jgi:AcrR family transcriptional regulator
MTAASLRTKEVILDAARAEFAEHGLAGGRVDRIAKAAGANVQRIYAYYTDKAGLFQAVATDAVEELVAAIGTEQRDIVDFAGTVFDYVTQNPANTRVMTWARLEREEEFFRMIHTGLSGATPISAVAQLQSAGRVTTRWDEGSILEAIIALCERWHSTASTAAPEEVTAHKELVLAFARTLATEPATR